MAAQKFRVLNAIWDHPIASASVLVIVILPPIYQLLLYFSPLLISTALCIAALVSMGSSSSYKEESNAGEVASSSSNNSRRSWVGWLTNLRCKGRAWFESKLNNDNTTVHTEEARLHERVVQLEHTLRRSYSSVSYEGIFLAKDGSVVDMDEEDEVVAIEFPPAEEVAAIESSAPPSKEDKIDENVTQKPEEPEVESDNSDTSWQKVADSEEL